MSRYDELSQKYLDFRSRQELANRIATEVTNAVRASLSAPQDAVSSSAVMRSDAGWRLDPSGVPTSKRHDDGRYYFAICTLLPAGGNQGETQIFATLLSVLVGRTDAEVRLEDTTPKFSAHIDDPSAYEDLAGEVIGVLEDALDPDLGDRLARLNIGFVAA
jgi:hypothetical protein